MAQRRKKRGRPASTRKDVVRMGAQGRIVLPREVRFRLGLSDGDELSLLEVEGGLFIKPLHDSAALLTEMRKRWAGLGLSVEELIRHRSEEARRERRQER